MGLCLPYVKSTEKEYRALYPAEAPHPAPKLLAAFKPQLSKWVSMLQRFLKNADDQVRGYRLWLWVLGLKFRL